MRSTLTGYTGEKGDKPTFVLDHVTRMRDDIAPEWPQPQIAIAPKDLGYGLASGRGLYRVEIDGSPSMRCEFEMADDHDHDLGARMARALALAVDEGYLWFWIGTHADYDRMTG